MLAEYKKHAATTKANPKFGADMINGGLKRLISYPFVAYQENGRSNIETTRKMVKRRDEYKRTERKLSRKSRRS
jgi:hypothetical protein